MDKQLKEAPRKNHRVPPPGHFYIPQDLLIFLEEVADIGMVLGRLDAEEFLNRESKIDLCD